MAFAGFTRDEFEKVLREHLSPTTPIRSPEFLRGRDRKLEDIRRSLLAQGRHIFIYGDRGVGKTSLAQTAAFEHQSADGKPILLACDPASGFYRLVHDLASALVHADPTVIKNTTSTKVAVSLRSILSGERQKSIERGAIPEMRSINEAVAVIDYAARLHSCAPVVVIDEFERIKSSEERMLFADFIKQIGDQTVPLKLIFCGVGAALDELLDSHHSCYRYLTAVFLERLGYDGRLMIIDEARKALALDLDDSTRFRIATISDGFPHFIHLLCEKLFWEAFTDPEIVGGVRPQHFVSAVRDAVQDIEPHLKSAYEKATKKYSDEYEEVLWAAADDKELSRRSSDIYTSYQRIMQTRVGREILSRERFNARMNALKRPTHGKILKANRQGWYSFTENITRGYVRLRAEEQGVELEVDHQLLSRRFGWLGTANAN